MKLMKRFKMMKAFLFPLTAGLILTFSLASCEQVTGFFSSSWGKGLTRDPAKLFPDVNAKNAQSLADETAGDPEAARALLKKIREAAAKAQGKDKEALLKAGLTAANNSSDVMGTVISNAGKLEKITNAENPEQALAEVKEMLEGLDDVQETAADLEALFEGADAATYEAMPPDELAIAALTLALAGGVEISKQGIQDIDPNKGGKIKIAYEMLKVVKSDEDSFFGGNGVFDDLPEEGTETETETSK
jgi:hypothetical protein